MTTLLAPGDALSRCYDTATWESHNLLDRFWDAVIVPTSEPVNIRDSFCSFEESFNDRTLFQSPEIFAKSGSNPVINIRSIRFPTLDSSCYNGKKHDGILPSADATRANTITPRRGVRIESSGPVRAPQITLQPATPLYPRYTESKTDSQNLKLSIPNRLQRRGTGVSSPGSALLAMASNFLGAIVRVGKSQSITSTAQREDNSIRIVDSEVLISVFDDVLRHREEAAGGLQHCEDGDWLDSAGSENPYSPGSARRQAGSAEEMDALAKISWERQLMNAQGKLWR